MTGLDLVSVQDNILTHIETTFPQFEIKEDFVLDDESLLKLDNKIKPFIVIRWGGLRRSVADASFAGPKKDSYISSFDVVAVAPKPRQCRQIINMIMAELTGWKVANLYPLTPDGGADLFTVAGMNARPHLYLGVNGFSFQVDSNALNNGS
jgi:hypothetical protein